MSIPETYKYFAAYKLLPDGKLAAVIELTFGRGRVTIGKPDGDTYDDSW